MRTKPHPVLEYGRVTHGRFGTEKDSGPQGRFEFSGPEGRRLNVIASDGRDWFDEDSTIKTITPAWEHVSVHAVDYADRPATPSWREMCFIKDIFWEEEEEVVQFHPPKSQYVDQHKHVLHLWKPIGVTFPMPPKECV